MTTDAIPAGLDAVDMDMIQRGDRLGPELGAKVASALSSLSAELETVKGERNQYARQIKQQEIREEVLGERLEAAEAKLVGGETSIPRSVSDTELSQWAEKRADDAGRLARELLAYRRVSAREIISQSLDSAYGPEHAQNIINDLTSAGWRFVGPDEVALITTALEHASFALDGVVALDDEDEGKDGASKTCQHTKRTVDRALTAIRAIASGGKQ